MDEPTEQLEAWHTCRTKVAAALQEYTDAFPDDHWVLTGFVTSMEYESLDGRNWFTWMAGNGTQDVDEPRGLTIWRVAGLLHHTLNKLYDSTDDD